MEYHEILGYAVDGLYCNLKRMEERDGVDSPQYKVISRKYKQIFKLYQKEHLEHIAKQITK